MNNLGLFIIFVFSAVCFVIVWKIQVDKPDDRITQDDLNRAHDRERIAAYWRDRGKVIKPRVHKSEWDGEIRYGAWVDETEDPT